MFTKLFFIDYYTIKANVRIYKKCLKNVSIFSQPNFFLNLFSHIVNGQTNTGENIKCKIQVFKGNQIQIGSITTNNGAEIKKPKIPKW